MRELIGAPGAPESLAQLAADREQPAIARASALASLAGYPESGSAASMGEGARDVSPLVRRAAARLLPDTNPQASPGVAALLLNDRVRDVRIEAAEALAGVTAGALSGRCSRSAREGHR